MIDKTAIIAPEAKLADNVKVGPFSIIGPKVEIDTGTEIASHVVIQGNTKIGKNNAIFQFSSIGTEPQDLKYQGEDTRLEIGDNNIIREYCSIHRGTAHGKGVTQIGNNNFLMAYVHVAHDCNLSNNIILANGATLAGHVVVGSGAVFGGSVVVAQFCKIGAYSFIVGTTAIGKDILPYTLISEYHNKDSRKPSPCGLNLVGLKRSGFDRKTILELKRAYRIIYKEDLSMNDQSYPDIC